MYMTEEEICRHYRQALDQKKDIAVLADLNAVDKWEIEEILAKAGMTKRPRRKKPEKPKMTGSREKLHSEIEKRLREGKSFRQVSAEVGCSDSTVRKRAAKLGIAPQGTNGAKARTPEEIAAAAERRRAREKAYYEANREKIAAKRRERMKDPQAREKHNAYMREYNRRKKAGL